MIVLYTWQIIGIVSICFLFGFGIGRTFGESRAWAKMDEQDGKEEEQPA